MVLGCFDKNTFIECTFLLKIVTEKYLTIGEKWQNLHRELTEPGAAILVYTYCIIYSRGHQREHLSRPLTNITPMVTGKE